MFPAAVWYPTDMKNVKLIGIGLVNYLIRFGVAGVLFQGLKVNPEGAFFGVTITLVALVVAYLLLRFVMRPATIAEALRVAVVWVLLALVLDVITGITLLKLPLGYYFSEWQTWTRLAAILAVAPFSVRKIPIS